MRRRRIAWMTRLARVARRAWPLLAGSAVAGNSARAQCPDGSPPPCRTAPARRVDPPLDSRTWIVLPFENVARSNDLEWLRDASANLLYLDLSRWTDIRVVDDERVSDLLRVVRSGGERPLALSTGLTVARRAGARQLIMGDVIRAGSRIAVIAKVFDVRNGQRVRSVREEATSADSMFAVFSKLARGVLDVAPPEGANVGALGTASVDAYKEYLTGVTALNAFDLPQANRRFDRALQLDSAFALAHYKFALSLLWGSARDPRGREHAEAALRLSGKLPARERTLIRAFAFFPRGEYGAMCDALAPLVRADSSDVDAMAGLADCMYHDDVVIQVGSDTSARRFRSSRHESMRLFRKVLQLDPTYHLAYQHLVDAYMATLRFGRPSTESPSSAVATAYLAIVGRDADTVVTAPTRLRAGTPQFDSARYDLSTLRSRRRNLQAADAMAAEWLAAAPNEPRAHRAMARTSLALGSLATAREHLAKSRGNLSQSDSVTVPLDWLDVSLRLFRVPDVARLADSMAASAPTSSNREVLAFASVLRGRFGVADSQVAATSGARLGPVLSRYQHFAVRAVLGLPADSAVLLEMQLPGPPEMAASRAQPTLMFALRHPRAVWPRLDSLPADLCLRPAAALARGDTSALRRAARALDSASRATFAGLSGDRCGFVVAADAYLALRDSVNARRVVVWALDTALATAPITFPVEPGYPFGLLFPRIMLLRADLEAAMGSPEGARLWYRRVLDLWAPADAELQPLLDRVRRSYAAVGGS